MPGAFDWLNDINEYYAPEMPSPEEARRRQRGMFGAAADLGGITSFLSNNLGTGEIAGEIGQMRGEDPYGAAAVDVVNPLSLGGMLLEGGKQLYDAWGQEGLAKPELEPLDKWLESRRTKPMTLAEYMDKAEADFRASPTAQQQMAQKGWTRTDNQAKEKRKQAAEEYPKVFGPDVLDAERQRLEEEYRTNVAGQYDRDLEAYYGQDFADRNPMISSLLAVGGPVLAGLATRGVFKGANKAIDDATDAVKAARKSKSVAAEAEALARLQSASTGAKWQKGGALAGSALIPLEAQMLSDYVDRKQSRDYQDSQGNWRRSRSQQKAEEKLSKPMQYIGDNSMALLSGILGSVWGGKLTKGKSGPEASAMLNPVPTQAYDDLAQRKIAAAKADRAVKRAVTGPKKRVADVIGDLSKGKKPALPPPTKAKPAAKPKTPRRKVYKGDKVEATSYSEALRRRLLEGPK